MDDPRFDRFWNVIADDVQATGPKTPEFPLTKSSRAVAEAIWCAGEPPVDSGSAAVDVGTGTGVHAFFMALRGYSRVVAVDVCPMAVECARARWERIRPRLESSGAVGDIEFQVRSVDGLPVVREAALMTFNPPAYYDFEGIPVRSPLESAVYVDDDWESAYRVETSAVYRFFAWQVLPALSPGGHAVCSWFGTERRLGSSAMPVEAEPPFHPIRLLAEWFGLDIDGVVPSGSAFFNRAAALSGDYGLGPAFWDNLARAEAAGLLHPHLFSPRRGLMAPGFKFGVLHVVRCTPWPGRRFRLVAEPGDPGSTADHSRVSTQGCVEPPRA